MKSILTTRKFPSITLALALWLPDALVAGAINMDMKADRLRSGYMGAQDMLLREELQKKNIASLPMSRGAVNGKIASGPTNAFQQNVNSAKSIQNEVARVRAQGARDVAALNNKLAIRNNSGGNSLNSVKWADPKHLPFQFSNDANALNSLKDLHLRMQDDSGLDVNLSLESLQAILPNSGGTVWIQPKIETEAGDFVVRPDMGDYVNKIPGKQYSVISKYLTYDPNGIVTNGVNRDTYQKFDKVWKLISNDHKKLTTFPDGSYGRQELVTTYSHDKRGNLTGAAGHGTSYSNDGFGNEIFGQSSQSFSVINGRARMTSFNMSARSQNTDGSTRNDKIERKIAYDAAGKKTGESESWGFTSDDGFGNPTSGRIFRTYSQVNNKAVVSSMRIESTSKNQDGSSLNQTLLISFKYDAKGQMAGAAGSGTFVRNDAWGDQKSGTVQQSFVMAGGKPRLTGVVTVSRVNNLDGSASNESFSTTFSYDAKGKLLSAFGSGAASSNDGFGNVMSAKYALSYAIINGAAKVSSVRMDSSDNSMDGSVLSKNVVLTYQYHSLGKLIGVSGKGEFSNGGRLIRSDSNQDGTVDALIPSQSSDQGTINFNFMIVSGQVKVSEVQVVSQKVSLDGRAEKSETSLKYVYDSMGRLIGMSGQTLAYSDDGFGNVTKTLINYSFSMILGQPRLTGVTLTSVRTALDGSVSQQNLAIKYVYDAKGRLIGASGQGTASFDDGFGNVQNESITLTFGIIAGQVRLTQEQRLSMTDNLDGSVYQKSMTYSYKYDAIGRLTAMEGKGAASSDDGYGNTTQQAISQSYVILAGEPRLASEQVETAIKMATGDSEQWVLETKLSYDSLGRIIGAKGEGRYEVISGGGIIDSGRIVAKYEIINGYPKLSGLEYISDNDPIIFIPIKPIMPVAQPLGMPASVASR